MSLGSLNLNLTFPNWNTYSRPVQSMINFFMKDAIACYQGNYTGSTLKSFSGNIRTKYRTVLKYGSDIDFNIPSHSLELNIPYSDDVQYPIEADTCLPNCVTTLTQKETKLKLCSIKYVEEGEGKGYREFFRASLFKDGVDPIDLIDVTITPKIGSAVNTDSTATLYGMNDNTPLVISDVQINSSNLVSDYQLRTPTLYLDDGEKHINKNVFWKIGIVPFNKNYPTDPTQSPVSPSTPNTVEKLKNELKVDTSSFSISADGYVKEGGYSFRLHEVVFKIGELLEMYNPSNYFSGGDIPISFIIPKAITRSFYIDGLLYGRLYSQDNTPIIQNDIGSYTPHLYYKRSEDDPDPVIIAKNSSEAYIKHQDLFLTDQNLDGGYIQTSRSTIIGE